MADGNGGKRGVTRAPPGQVKVNVNLNELEPMSCPACNGVIFDTSLVRLKKLGAVQSPTGKPLTVKIEIVACVDCGALYQIVGDILQPVFTPPMDTAD